MTEAQAMERLSEARRKAARFRRLRNFWRVQVRRRMRRLAEIRTEGPHLVGDSVQGGNLPQRLDYLFKVAPALFRLYYSENGNFADFLWAVHNVPNDTWRSDCSAWARSVVAAVRVLSPNFSAILVAGGTFYTGWVVEHCKQVDRMYAENHIGTAVVYGTGTGFHMGLSRGQGSATIEHGTASLDYGNFDEFGAGTAVRFYQFLT